MSQSFYRWINQIHIEPFNTLPPRSISKTEFMLLTSLKKAHLLNQKCFDLFCQNTINICCEEKLTDFIEKSREILELLFILATNSYQYHANKIKPQVEIHGFFDYVEYCILSRIDIEIPDNDDHWLTGKVGLNITSAVIEMLNESHENPIAFPSPTAISNILEKIFCYIYDPKINVSVEEIIDFDIKPRSAADIIKKLSVINPTTTIDSIIEFNRCYDIGLSFRQYLDVLNSPYLLMAPEFGANQNRYPSSKLKSVFQCVFAQ